MSFSSRDLTTSKREAIARSLYPIKNQKGSELHGLCPFHEEDNPSFSYNFEKDVYHCLSCGAGGNLIALWTQIKGFDQKTGYKEFCKKYNPDQKKKTPSNAKPIDDKAWQNLETLPDDWKQRCKEKFGWSLDVIDRFDLRIKLDKDKNKRICIPIKDDKGIIRNVRQYLPGASENKVVSWAVGYGKSRLFPSPSSWQPGQIFLCEGEKDTLCALSQGLNAITHTTGVNTWKDEFNKFFIDRDIVICYDADKPGEKGAHKAARSLAKVAKTVRILLWPEYMGFTKDHGQDLTDFFVKHGKKLSGFKDLLAESATIDPPTEDEISDTSYERFFVTGETGRKSFRPVLLAGAIMDDLDIVFDADKDIIYRWEGNIWKKLNFSHLENRALIMLQEMASTARARDAASIVKNLSVLSPDREMNDLPGWLCLKNGMFNIDTRESRPFEKDFFATFSLDIEYIPGSLPPCDRWELAMAEILGDDDTIKEVQKFFGYCLTRETRYEKALLLIGPGGDGKSVLLDVLQSMIGKDNTSNVSMDMLDNEFYLSMLDNKLLNVSSEIRDHVFSSKLFKQIVTGDTISASHKNKDPFSFKPFCKLAFSSNKPPKVMDNSDGFFRKVMLVELNNRFTAYQAEDIFLRDKLMAELSGIFAWSLKGLDMLKKEGFTPSRKMTKDLQGFRRSNNPVKSFIDDYCEFRPDFEISKSHLYKEYRSYCSNNGYRPFNIAHFGREIFNLCPEVKTGRYAKGDRRMKYIGIDLCDPLSPSTPLFSTNQNDPSTLSREPSREHD